MQQASDEHGAAGTYDDYVNYLEGLDQLNVTLVKVFATLDTLIALANQGQKQIKAETEKTITDMKQHLVILCNQKDIHPCLELVESHHTIHTISSKEPKLALASIQDVIIHMIGNLKVEIRNRKLNTKTISNSSF